MPGYCVDIDDRCAPLTVYAGYGAAATAEELQRVLLDHLEREYESGQLVGHVFDLTHSSPIAPPVREYLTAWVALNRGRIARSNVAVAVVVRSRSLQVVLSALFWFQPPPARAYRVFADRTDALQWVHEELARCGVAVDAVAYADLVSTPRPASNA